MYNFILELIQLLNEAYAIIGWTLYGMLGMIVLPVLFSFYLFIREYQQNKRERRLAAWETALQRETERFWGNQQSPA